tara:strand:+ start:3980 stop:4495 length:516 start_codon:yes stop_codon:yes gene_type:complete
MAIIKVNLTDTINGFRLKTNTLAETVGDLSDMSTSGGDSSVVAGVNSLDSDMGRQADLHYRESSDSTFLTLVDAINRIVDSDGNIKDGLITMDSDSILNHMIADNQVDSDHILVGSIDSDHLKDSAIFGAKFEGMTVLKIFASNGTELRKLYAPSIFDHDSAIAYATNPWV